MKANPLLLLPLMLSTAALAEQANPKSEPLKDRSEKASRESRPVEDESNRAGTDTAPAGQDAAPVKDDGGNANEASRPVKDNAEKAGTDVTKVDDSVPQKASPDARKNRDRSQKAGPAAAKVRDGDPDKASPDSRLTSPEERRRKAVPPPVELPPENAIPDATAAAEAKAAAEAEAAVKKSTADLERGIRARKLKIQGPDDARSVIEEVLGKESLLSRAELDREARTGARRKEREAREDAAADISDEQRRTAALFLRQRLGGQEAREMPPFFRRPPRESDVGVDELAVAPPRFLHEGRRFLHFHSRDAIPAVLLASAQLQRVRVQPAREVDAPLVRDGLPDGYRGDDAWVVSYAVDRGSMVSSNDILFRQGSTQFADAHAYEMVLALSDAMNDPSLAGARFVIEGHASAEGSFDDNQILSQLRAEAIVREMVRGGITPERLIPVGYGESEARHPADAPESLRGQDRRVIVFRLDERNPD